MNVLFWTENFLPFIGGVEVLSANLMRALQSRGHEVAIITNGVTISPFEERWEDIRVFRFPFRQALAASDLPAMRVLCEGAARARDEFGPDVVHLHIGGPSSFYQLHSGTVTAVPCVATLHGAAEQTGHLKGAIGRILDGVQVITAVSEFVRRDALAHKPDSASRLRVALNACPTEHSAIAAAVAFPPRLLCIGRVHEEKGFDVAIAALALLARDGTQPAPELWIAGTGPALNDLHEQARRLGVEAQTIFMGATDPREVPALLDTATIVLVPSRWKEAFGLTALEAIQRGCAVVASNIGGLPEIVVPEVSGVLVEPDSAAALANAIAALLCDVSRLDALRVSASQYARERFDFDAFVSAYECAYSDAMRARNQTLTAD